MVLNTRRPNPIYNYYLNPSPVCSIKFIFKHVKRACARCKYQAHSGSDTTSRCTPNLQDIIIIIIIILSTGSKTGISTYGWGSNRLTWIIFTWSEAGLVKTPHTKHNPQTQGFVKWYFGKRRTSVRLRTDKVRISLFSITPGTINPVTSVDCFTKSTHQ